MLSTLLFAKILADKTHAARRIAAQIGSGFAPGEKLAPITHEALCYACMIGIAVPPHHDIMPTHPSH